MLLELPKHFVQRAIVTTFFVCHLHTNIVLRKSFDIPIKEYIDAEWDHRMLNDVVPFNTTVERLAEFLFKRFKPQFPLLSAITLKETPTTFARYEQ